MWSVILCITSSWSLVIDMQLSSWTLEADSLLLSRLLVWLSSFLNIHHKVFLYQNEPRSKRRRFRCRERLLESLDVWMFKYGKELKSRFILGESASRLLPFTDGLRYAVMRLNLLHDKI